MVEPAHVALGQTVAVSQPGPAVGPLHEFIAESELQIGMPLQVGERADAQPRRNRSRMPMA